MPLLMGPVHEDDGNHDEVVSLGFLQQRLDLLPHGRGLLWRHAMHEQRLRWIEALDVQREAVPQENPGTLHAVIPHGPNVSGLVHQPPGRPGVSYASPTRNASRSCATGTSNSSQVWLVRCTLARYPQHLASTDESAVCPLRKGTSAARAWVR